jgi:hypothetical protein
MRPLLLILTLFLPQIIGFRPDDSLKSELADNPSGFINITVLSNINRQVFHYNLKQQCLPTKENSEILYSHGRPVSSIIIPVKEFNCTDKLVYKDFLTLLKAELYPYLEIDIPIYSGIEYNSGDSVLLKGMTITVAGVSKEYDINCKIDRVNNESQILNGTSRIKLTDLKIVPPVKLLGLIKVQNEIIINFEFCLKSVGI